MKFFVGCFFLCGVVSLSFSGESEKNWANETELAFVSSHGNTKSQNIGAKNLLKVPFSFGQWDLEGGARGSKDKNEVSAENYFAGEKLSIKIKEKFYGFKSFRWDKDRFAGIRNRYNVSLGAGVVLLSVKNDSILSEWGGGYVNEQRLGEKRRNEFGTGRGFLKYTHAFHAKSKFYLQGEYLHNFDNPDDYRSEGTTGLLASLSSVVALKFSYKINFVNRPPLGFGKTDTVTATTLLINY